MTNGSMRTLLRLETIPAIRFESCVIFPYGPIGWKGTICLKLCTVFSSLFQECKWWLPRATEPGDLWSGCWSTILDLQAKKFNSDVKITIFLLRILELFTWLLWRLNGPTNGPTRGPMSGALSWSNGVKMAPESLCPSSWK